MQRTKSKNAVAAAAVIAAVIGIAGGAGWAIVGCRAFPRAGGVTGGVIGGAGDESVAQASASVASAAGAIDGVAGHTRSADRLVEQAQPHADVVGQVQLQVARGEHAAVLADAQSAQTALSSAQGELANARRAASAAEAMLAQERQLHARLEGQWYVLWGLRAEKAFWTLCTVAGVGLIGSALSMFLGGGNPLSWLAGARSLFTRRQSWIGETFVK